MDVSIIIVSYKTRGLVKNCLRSLAENLAGTKLKYDIWVVDNDSNDGTVELVQEKFPNVNLKVLNKNYGYAKAVNEGIKVSSGKYIFLVNPDMLFLEGRPIEEMFDFMEVNRNVGIVGPKLINPDKSIQYSCRKFENLLMPLYRRTILKDTKKGVEINQDFLMSDWEHNQIKEVDWVIGTGLFARRDMTESLGGMDERFFMYYEDVDLCRRFWQNNWKVVYYPKSPIIHYHGRMSAESFGIVSLFSRGTRIHIKSWLKYFIKYFKQYKYERSSI